MARIDKLARWTFPLLEEGGVLVALKGEQAARELDEERGVLERLGMVASAVHTYGASVLEVPTVALELTVGARGAATTPPRGSRLCFRDAPLARSASHCPSKKGRAR